jgi:hypothetical protein
LLRFILNVKIQDLGPTCLLFSPCQVGFLIDSLFLPFEITCILISPLHFLTQYVMMLISTLQICIYKNLLKIQQQIISVLA